MLIVWSVSGPFKSLSSPLKAQTPPLYKGINTSTSQGC